MPLRIPTDVGQQTQQALRDLDLRLYGLERSQTSPEVSKADLNQLAEALRAEIRKAAKFVPAFPDVAAIMRPSGDSHAAGVVPDPGAAGGTDQVLHEDAKWKWPLSGNLVDVTNVGQTGDAINRYDLQGGLIVNGPLAASDAWVDGLTVEGTLLSKPPHARLTHSITQSALFTTGNAVVIAFDTDITNIGGIHSTTINNSRITATKAGWWAFGGQFEMNNNTGGAYRNIFVQKNGSAIMCEAIFNPPLSTLITRIFVHGQGFLALNDYIELVGKQDSGSSLDCTVRNSGTAQEPVFWATWLSP